MTPETLTELIHDCKVEVQITWSDDDTDHRIINHIKDGVSRLKRICGVDDTDFLSGGKAHALLLAYVRRANDGDTSTFNADYLDEIIALQNDKDVEEYGDTAETQSI